MGLSKRLVGGLAAVVALALMSGAPRAEDYPARPIRVVVGFGPGAVADVILRV